MHGIIAAGAPQDQAAKVGGRPRRRRGKQAGGEQEYRKGQSHGYDRGSGERRPLWLELSLRQAQAMRGVLCATPIRPLWSSRMMPP